jgi:multidrug efflux pump subunit AcrB
LPQGEVTSIIDNIGLPVSGINYAYSDSQTISAADGEILVSLSEHRKHNTQYYEQQVRSLMRKQFPQYTSYFQPADIVTQILNAGLPAPIAVRIVGVDKLGNYERALNLMREIRLVQGAVDVTLHQLMNGPHVQWDVNRTKAGEMELTQNDASSAFLISLSSSFQTKPNFYLDRKSGITYNLATQTPQSDLANLDSIATIPVTAVGTNNQSKPSQMLFNIAHPVRSRTPEVVNHINVLRCYDIYASCQGRDLGGVAMDINEIVKRHEKLLPRGNFIIVGGQWLAMLKAFIALLSGLVFALILVYLLLVVNFQSWTDPLIILMATPGALSGILWSLFVTHTAFSIPALMGTIMTVGVASANSILMVTFAKEQLSEGQDSETAAYNAGFQRFRPVIMTATAMIIGMIPMAIGSGEGGSQNAPIGRAVVGGLIVATFSTLFFVPLFFSILRRARKTKSVETSQAGVHQ